MKKKFSSITIFASSLLTSNSFAGEVLGYPVAPTQAKFYMLILGLLGVSIGLVAASYFAFWALDLKKKGKVRKAAVREQQAFAGELAVAAQSAK
jgi:hypothetical protein